MGALLLFTFGWALLSIPLIAMAEHNLTFSYAGTLGLGCVSYACVRFGRTLHREGHR